MKKTFIIQELDCAHCAAKMEEEIKNLEGVACVSVNFLAGKLVLEADDRRFDEVFKAALEIIKKIEPDCNVIF